MCKQHNPVLWEVKFQIKKLGLMKVSNEVIRSEQIFK